MVASLGVDSGYVPYTAYCAKKSYFEDNPEVIQSFTNAIQKGINYVNSHSAKEIAEVIAPQFAETSVENITIIVERYKEQDTWKEDTIFTEESFNLLDYHKRFTTIHKIDCYACLSKSTGPKKLNRK